MIDPEQKRLALQRMFTEQTGTPVINSQGEPDIEYVDWLEDRNIRLEENLRKLKGVECKAKGICGFYEIKQSDNE